MVCPRQVFAFKHRFQRFTLKIRQIVLHVFTVKGEQPELHAGQPVVVNDADAAPFSLVPKGIGEPDLSKPSGSSDDIACIGATQQDLL